MARSEVIINQFDAGTITLKDGTSETPLEVEVLFDNGDISLSGMNAEGSGHTAYKSRRRLVSLRKTDLEFPTGSFSAMASEFTEATTGTVLDMIHGTTGTPFAARVSTTASKGDVMTFDLVLAIEGSDYGGVDSTLTLADCHLTWDFSSGDPNTLSFSFTVYGAITGDLAAFGLSS